MFIEKLNAAKYDPNADMELPYNSHQASYNAGLEKAREIYEADHIGGGDKMVSMGASERKGSAPCGQAMPIDKASSEAPANLRCGEITDNEEFRVLVEKAHNLKVLKEHLQSGDNYFIKKALLWLIEEREAAKASEQPDDCRKEFEQRFADKHTEEEFATFKDGSYNKGHINADWIAFQNGWNSRLPKREISREWLYAYRQNVRQDGVEKHFITFSSKYPSTLKNAECLGRISLQQIGSERK